MIQLRLPQSALVACVSVLLLIPGSPGVTSDADPPCSSSEGEACSAISVEKTLSEVEEEEEAESAVMEVRLLQRTVQTRAPALVATSGDHVVAKAEVADAEGQVAAARRAVAASNANANANASQSDASLANANASASASQESDSVVSIDHNGHVCMLCGKPLPQRVGDKKYTKFRLDCGTRSSPTGPTAADMTVPAVSFAKSTGAAAMNGFCALNFAKSCADAVANEDYLYWPKSLDLSSAAMSANAPWDARYCSLNGFLQREVVSLQHNFTGMRAKAQELCRTKYSSHNIEKLTFLDMMSRSRYDDKEAPTLEEAELLAAWNCAMGDLGCDMAMCAYSFCHKDRGATGLYSECAGWDPVAGMPM